MARSRPRPLVKIRAALVFCAALPLLAQYPTPHSGWKLVPGAENLIASGYPVSVYQWNNSFADLSSIVDNSIAVSNGVLNVASGNEYTGNYLPLGPWLSTTAGNFGVTATIQTSSSACGFVSLFGALPVGTQYWQGTTEIYAGVDSAGNYIFAYFNGKSSGPASYMTLKAGNGAPVTGSVTVEMLRQDGQFYVSFNGTQYGPFADPGLFTNNYVMPGFQAPPNKTLTVTQFALEAPQGDTAAQLIQTVGAIPYTKSGDTPGSLAAIAGRDFSIVVDPSEWGLGVNTVSSYTSATPSPALEPQVVAQFGAFATIDANYWNTEAAQGFYAFDLADATIVTAKGTGRPMVNCGDLIDGSRIPEWILKGNYNASQLTQIMETHIQTVMTHYRGQCNGWTVVNEAFDGNGAVRTDLIWQQVIGSNYIDLAFETAHQVDPTVPLYLKDYGGENNNAKGQGIYNYVSGMVSRGEPINGVAMQSHWVVGSTSDCCVPNHDSIVANMARLAALGLSVRISEMDVQVPQPTTSAGLATEATYFSTAVQACLDSPNCKGISVFGIDDALSWISYTFPGYGAGTMFDATFTPKPAYTAVMNTLRAATPARPVITGVTAAWGGATIAQNTFVTIKGFNLVPTTTPAAGVVWSSAPSFAQGQMPTQLNGISVTVNGKPAFIYFYCSVATSPVCTADQISVLTPLDSAVGTVQVVVTNGSAPNGSVSTAPFPVTMAAAAPTFLLFNATGPIVATHANYALLGSGALYPGYSTPAQPGETILSYAVGFGLPTNTLTNGSSLQSGSLPAVPVCQVGGQPAIAAAALISAGLYQLNLTIPPTAQDGNNAVACTYNGSATQSGAYVTVQH